MAKARRIKTGMKRNARFAKVRSNMQRRQRTPDLRKR